MEDLVSIITPNHNGSKFLEETINSVIAQTYPHWEMIIIDDCSKDNSIELINDFTVKDDRIILISNSINTGPALARNRGIEAAKGRFIAFIDSDDLWLPEKLEKQIQLMRTNNAVLSYTAYKKINEKSIIISNTIEVPQRITYKKLLHSCSIGILTAMYDTKLLGRIFMPDMFSVEDYGLWLKILRSNHIAYGINEPLALYRVHRNAISRNKLKKAMYQWKVYRNLEKLSFIRSIYYMIHYTYFGFKKYIT